MARQSYCTVERHGSLVFTSGVIGFACNDRVCSASQLSSSSLGAAVMSFCSSISSLSRFNLPKLAGIAYNCYSIRLSSTAHVSCSITISSSHLQSVLRGVQLL